MQAQVNILYVANLVALFGVSFNVIPLGHYFASHLGVGPGWTFSLLLSKLPVVVLAPLLIRWADRRGAYHVIHGSLWLATIFWFLSALSLPFHDWRSTSVLMGAAFCCGAPLCALFPAFLNVLAPSTDRVQSSLSNWQIVKYAALLAATGLGGYLNEHLSLTFFLAVQGIGFFICFVAWHFSRQFESVPLATPPRRNFRPALRRFFAPPNLANFFRRIMYGILQPLLPVFILNEFGATSSTLANLYLCLGIAAIAGAQWAKRAPLFVSILMTLALSEGALILSGFLSERLLFFFVFVTLAVVLMSIVNVGLQTIYFSSAPKSESHWLSGVFEGSANFGRILGYVIYGVAFSHEVHPPLIPAILLLVIASVGSLLTGAWAITTPRVRRIRLRS